MTDSTTATATAAALIDHGAGIRTLQVGPIQITKAIAVQLYRCEIWTNHPVGFTGIARVNTGTTVLRDRIKPEYRHYPKHLLDDLKHYETYNAEPTVEVIGYYPEDGELVIFQICYGDLHDEDLDLAAPGEDWPAIRRTVATWSDLPLAVLP